MKDELKSFFKDLRENNDNKNIDTFSNNESLSYSNI